jgi:hypothetical protein
MCNLFIKAGNGSHKRLRSGWGAGGGGLKIGATGRDGDVGERIIDSIIVTHFPQYLQERYREVWVQAEVGVHKSLVQEITQSPSVVERSGERCGRYRYGL